MAKLSLYMPPFAADYSGAAGVLFGLDSLNIIVDASCCTRGYTGCDEPRWNSSRKSTFGAQLRTLEATLGDDARLLDQTEQSARDLGVSCIALIGTPVPALVGMDFDGMACELEQRCGVPAFGISTTGFGTYELGASAAQEELVRRFAEEARGADSMAVNILGATIQDYGSEAALGAIAAAVCSQGRSVVLNIGGGYSPADIAAAAMAGESIVASWSGLAAARMLERRFGVPVRVGVPRAALEALAGAKTLLAEAPAACVEWPLLIVHDQVIANGLRDELRAAGVAQPIAVASFFSMDDALMEPGDFRIRQESDLIEFAEGHPECAIAGDPLLARLPHVSDALRWNLPHEAISSTLFLNRA